MIAAYVDALEKYFELCDLFRLEVAFLEEEVNAEEFVH
jgi:hypothetical protein